MTRKPLKLNPKVVYRLLSDDGTYATVLQIIALIAYGENIYQVDPMDVILELEDQFNVNITDDNENKLKAILLATGTDIFYEEPEAFRGICETLTSGDPGPQLLETLTLPEVVFGIYEVELNHGPHEFRPEVQRVINQVVASEFPEDALPDNPYEYVWSFIQDAHRIMTGQLIELGVQPSDIPPPDTPSIPGLLEADLVQ